MSTLADPAVRMVLRIALAALFFWAAVHKLRDLASFRAALSAYALLPHAAVRLSSVVLVALELVTAAALSAPPQWAPAAGGAWAAAALLSLYSVAIGVNLLRGRSHIGCGCAGAVQRRSLSWYLVIRNGGLVTAALANAFPPHTRDLTWIDGLTIVGGVTTLALLYIAVDSVIATAPAIAALSHHYGSRLGSAAGRPEVEHA